MGGHLGGAGGGTTIGSTSILAGGGSGAGVNTAGFVGGAGGPGYAIVEFYA
jgi:hypothetical protein